MLQSIVEHCLIAILVFGSLSANALYLVGVHFARELLSQAPDLTGGALMGFREFGVAVGTLVFLLIFLWRLAVWIGKELVVPLRDRHIAFLDKNNEAMDKLVTMQAAIVSGQVTAVERQDKIIITMATFGDKIDVLTARFNVLEKKNHQ